MADIENLNEARAHKEKDCRLWSPLEALEALVRDIKSGELNPSQLVVHHLTENEDKSQSLGYVAAGVTLPDHIALLRVAETRLINDWFVE